MWHVAYHHVPETHVKPRVVVWWRKGVTDERPTIDHLGIAVRDADAAAAWFTERIGFSVVHDERLVDPPVRLLYLDAGNVTLQLVEPLGAGRISAFIDDHGEGLHHLCLRVSDVIAASRTYAPDAPGAPFPGGRGQRTCFLDETPSGIVIELAEPPVDEVDGAVRT